MKARLSNHRQAPRKVALVAHMIRGKKVVVAQRELTFLPKKVAPTLKKLLDSAVANARSAGATPEELFIKTITVNKGAMQKRYRPFSRGRSGVIRKTMSHVEIELGKVENGNLKVKNDSSKLKKKNSKSK
ncbi:50S ribosomal protein L22 [Candidatus Parcubacteria bacterium]|nr:MAG: 50S ribosomal protein L22 [Candidatus Parcubacteria bacterium]